MTSKEAIEISRRRTYQDTETSDFANGRRKNTVFESCKESVKCRTNNPEFGDMIISRYPVSTIQCEKANSHSCWTSQELGNYHSIFDAETGHFPGHLYDQVFFP